MEFLYDPGLHTQRFGDLFVHHCFQLCDILFRNQAVRVNIDLQKGLSAVHGQACDRRMPENPPDILILRHDAGKCLKKSLGHNERILFFPALLPDASDALSIEMLLQQFPEIASYFPAIRSSSAFSSDRSSFSGTFLITSPPRIRSPDPFPPAIPISASRASPGPLTTHPMTATLIFSG